MIVSFNDLLKFDFKKVYENEDKTIYHILKRERDTGNTIDPLIKTTDVTEWDLILLLNLIVQYNGNNELDEVLFDKINKFGNERYSQGQNSIEIY